jgi:group I intron endonuclease
MPYKDKISGIYSITSPTEKKYYGSSINIYHRWSEHRGNLRRGKHHSKKLQDEYDLFPNCMRFEIVEICDSKDFNIREQYYIDNCKNSLNTALFISNVWITPSTREKFKKIHNSEKWKEERSKIASRERDGWVSVDCGNGKTYKSYAEAAREFKTTASHIYHLCKCQKVGKLGFRFKRSIDKWIDEHPIKKKGRNPKPVKGICIKTNKVFHFKSQEDAARYVNSDKSKACKSSICWAAKGKLKSAYGYIWSYD